MNIIGFKEHTKAATSSIRGLGTTVDSTKRQRSAGSSRAADGEQEEGAAAQHGGAQQEVTCERNCHHYVKRANI